MGLSERQHLLARLLTDADLRTRFCSNPVAVGQELALTPEDIAALSALVMPDVERSARSLCAKRWNEIEKLLPLSVSAADQGQVPLHRWFLQFAQTGMPQGSRRHVQDAIAFADWCGQQPAPAFSGDIDNIPDWLPDLMRYEAVWLAAALDTRPRFVVVRRFRFPVHLIARALAQNAFESLPTANLLSRTSLCLWFRWSQSSKVNHFIQAGIMNLIVPHKSVDSDGFQPLGPD